MESIMATKNKKVTTKLNKNSAIEFIKAIDTKHDLSTFAPLIIGQDEKSASEFLQTAIIAIETALKANKPKTNSRRSSNMAKFISMIMETEFLCSGNIATFDITNSFLEYGFKSSNIKYASTDFKHDYPSVGAWLLRYNLKVSSRKSKNTDRVFFVELLDNDEKEKVLKELATKKQFKTFVKTENGKEFEKDDITFSRLSEKYKSEFSHDLYDEKDELIDVAHHIKELRLQLAE